MLHMIFGGAGTGKSTYLLSVIKDWIARGEGETLRTLVPEQFAYTFDMKLYDALGPAGFNALKTGSFRSLTAELLEHTAAEPRDAADEVAKTVTLHRLLMQHAKDRSLLFFGRHADKLGFQEDMAGQLAELMQSGNTPAQLADAAAALSGSHGALSEKLNDIARIYADYLDALDAQGLRDVMGDPMTAAAAADGTGYLRGSRIFLDEYESFTGDQYAMLEVMLRDAADVYIACRSDDPTGESFTRFDAVNQTVARLRLLAADVNCPVEDILLTEQHRFCEPSLAHLSRHLLTSDLPAYPDVPAVTLTEARDTTLEAECAAAQIRLLLQSGEYRASDITVVMHDLGDYGAQLEAAFRRYEIPYFMDLRRSVLYTAVMKLPLALLALMQRTTTEQILLFLKTQLSPLHPAEAADLENYAFVWGIAGEQWEHPFVPETDPKGRYEAIRQKLMPPLLRMRRKWLKSGGGEQPGAMFCEWLYACMDELAVPMRIGGIASRMKEQNDVQGGRALRKLWNRFTELLDALHAAMAETVVSPTQFAELLTAVLRTNQIAQPPQTLDAVVVQTAAAARYDAPKAVFVLGVNDGKFPAEISGGGFFTEQERGWLAEQKISLSRSVRDLCADERLIVYKTLSAPSQHLWLSYALAGENGSRMNVSTLTAELMQLFPRLTVRKADALGAAFYVTTKAAAYYSYVQDYRLTAEEQASVRAVLADMPGEADRLAALETASSPERLRVQDKTRMRRLTGDSVQMSATFMEDLMKCPFLGFCRHGLRLNAPEKKNLGALSAGQLVHACMEQLFLQHPERADFLAMTKTDLQQHAESVAADFLRDSLGGKAGKSERFLQQLDRMTRRMTLLLLHTQNEMRQSEFLPDACELVIGRLGEETGTAPYRLTLPNGMELCFSGKVDRVDVTEQDGSRYLRVIDYKTGEKLFRLCDLYYGLNLQMLIYLFALLDDPAAYPGAMPAGVLYVPSGAPKPRDREGAPPPEQCLGEYFRMNGTVLMDRGILTKMEQELAGVYIPAALDKDDDGGAELKLGKGSMVFTAEQLGRLRRYVEELLTDCALRYAEGDVAPSPIQPPGSSKAYADACKYCQYKSLCGVNKQQHSHLLRIADPEPQAEQAMRGIMNGEEDAT